MNQPSLSDKWNGKLFTLREVERHQTEWQSAAIRHRSQGDPIWSYEQMRADRCEALAATLRSEMLSLFHA